MDLLLYTSVDPFSYQIIPDLGLMYVAAAARGSGFGVAIKDCRKEGWDARRAGDHAGREKPLVVGVKSYSNEASRTSEMAAEIRRSLPGAVIIMGGPYPSMDPADVLARSPEVDYAFMGEAEKSLPLFMEWVKAGRAGEPPSSVAGVAYRKDGRTVVRPPEFHRDLEDLPLPAWDLMPPEKYPDEAAGIFTPGFPAAPMMLSRGCPFQCAYCGGRYVMGPRIRYRPAASVIREIDLLQKEHGVKSVTFVDDGFTTSRERAIELFQALAGRERKIGFTFPNGVRADSLDPEMVRLMEKAGCYSLALGIESGSDETLKRMRKRQTVEGVRKTVEMIRRESSIRVTGFFILGYPGESLADVRETIRFAAGLPIHHAHFCLFIPVPGTPVHEELLEKGWISDRYCDPEDLTIDRAGTELPGLPTRKLLRLHQYAYLRFYSSPWRALNLVLQLHGGGHFKVILRRFLKLF